MKGQCSICKDHFQRESYYVFKCKHESVQSDTPPYIVCADCLFERSDEQRLKCSICYSYLQDERLSWFTSNRDTCPTCLKSCEQCGRSICPAHMIDIQCSACRAVEITLCDDCEKTLDRSSLSFSHCNYCDECVCRSCGLTCMLCGRKICRAYVSYYETNESYICDDCLIYEMENRSS